LFIYLRGEANKVILVTSSIPGEGKSFAAFNLATSFAFANSKTVLVEFDLRKPSEVMNGFNTEGIPGASSYLINRATLEEIIIKTEEPNLDIIQAGQIPPNPVALLADIRTHELIKELRRLYDFVIIDTPPYGLLADSFLLMDHSELTLFVTRLGYTKKTAFANSIEDLEMKKIKNLHILVNGEKEVKLTIHIIILPRKLKRKPKTTA
jgi:capsular exopolysaccharide synthesis family protein